MRLLDKTLLDPKVPLDYRAMALKHVCSLINEDLLTAIEDFIAGRVLKEYLDLFRKTGSLTVSGEDLGRLGSCEKIEFRLIGDVTGEITGEDPCTDAKDKLLIIFYPVLYIDEGEGASLRDLFKGWFDEVVASRARDWVKEESIEAIFGRIAWDVVEAVGDVLYVIRKKLDEYKLFWENIQEYKKLFFNLLFERLSGR